MTKLDDFIQKWGGANPDKEGRLRQDFFELLRGEPLESRGVWLTEKLGDRADDPCPDYRRRWELLAEIARRALQGAGLLFTRRQRRNAFDK